jgi:acyl-CoA thioesterase-1
MMQAKYSRTLLFVSLLAACGGGQGESTPSGDTSRTAQPPTGGTEPTVLVLGTSLTAGLGIDPSQAWPAVLQRIIDSAGLSLRVVNAGVSGETSAGALRRVDWLLQRELPAVFMLETGGNDGLRGQDPDSLKANILAILSRARRLQPSPRLILFAMEAPPNLGDEYTRRFRAVYPEAARAAGATLVPFFLVGIAGVDTLNQPDGIHPTARGARLAAENAWKVLEPVLRQVRVR